MLITQKRFILIQSELGLYLCIHNLISLQKVRKNMGAKPTVLMLAVLLLLAQQSLSFDARSQMKPIELFSVQLTAQNLTQGLNKLEGKFLELTHILQTKPQALAHSQIIGSISNIDLTQDAGLQFHFTSTMDRSLGQVYIKVYYRSFLGAEFSQNLKITIDFLIAQFPLAFYIEVFNMTDYQEHVMHHLDDPRLYELVTFVNGFSNISLSGNVTHSFNPGGEMFTVHYMTCEGEEAKMGWIDQRDYILFTMVVLPKPNVIQKFHLYEHEFHVDNLPAIQFFYGYKGSSDQQISGRFIENYQGTTFQISSLKKDYSYGLIFIPMPEDIEYIDNRVHENTYKVKIASGAAVLGIIAVIGVFVGYRAFKNRSKSQEEAYLKEEVPTTDISQISKRGKHYTSSEEDNSPTRKEPDQNNDYRISTVPEVQEGLEGSLRGSKQSSRKGSINDGQHGHGQGKYLKFQDQEGGLQTENINIQIQEEEEEESEEQGQAAGDENDDNDHDHDLENETEKQENQ